MKKTKSITKKLLVVLVALISLSFVTPKFAETIGITQTVQAAVKLNATSVTLIKGQKKTLKVSGTTKTVTWSSGKTSVATVSSKGVVVAKKAGTATITAKVGSKKYTCKVTVEEPKLSKSSIIVTAGKTYQLKVSGTAQTITWKSADKTIATVNKNGKVTAKAAGTTTIKATVGGKTYSCKVTVETPKLNKTSVSVTVGKTYQLKLNGTTRTVTWESGNKKVATVNKNGKVTAKAVGTTTIKATVGKTTYSCKVTVKAATNTQTAAFNKIKNYIITNGSTNDDGNKFIRTAGVYEGTAYVWGIVYVSSENALEFILASEDDDSVAALSMKFKVTISAVNPEFVFVLRDYNYGFTATANINVKQYTGNTNVTFTITDEVGSGVSYSTKNNLANSYLKLGFKGWNNLLLADAGTSFKELGFTSYN